MKINLLVAPYRDSYFHNEFGSAVRDLQFLETLAFLEEITSITVLNRPVSVLERLLLKKPIPKKMAISKVKTIDITSKDLFGAIKGRAWAEDIYAEHINHYLTSYKKDDCLNVFLDFLPIGKFNPSNLDGWYYWYDFIDNFIKHNRFSNNEKSLVQTKYQFVAQYSDFVSAVSDVCLELNGPYKKATQKVISNKVFNANKENISNKVYSKKYDFGFIGFITDKFDIECIKKLSSNYTVAIYGQVLDKSIGKQLALLKNVHTLGKFTYKDVPSICQTFKVGLLPYLAEKSHDGSPLKLYEYMKYNIPCITSIDYEISDRSFIRNYNNSSNLLEDIKDMFSISGDNSISQSIKQEWKLEFNLQEVVSEIIQMKGKCK